LAVIIKTALTALREQKVKVFYF